MATVELVDVGKVFPGTVAVSRMSLRIPQGEFLALLGPSGCGKTTTLNLLAGFMPPTTGEILFNDVNVTGIPPHERNIGVVFQSYALFPHMTVFENVAFGLRMRKVEESALVGRVRRALDIVHLGQLEDRYSRQLSGGQQQRVALARALVIEPAVLLLDEPLSNLDASLREKMRFEIREIQKRVGITTVFVTHDQSEAMAAADRLVVMNKGVIQQVGTAREIYESPADPFVASFIGQANLLHGVVTALDEGHALVRLNSGETIRVPWRAGTEIGQRAIVVLRPEDASVAAEPLAAGNAIAGQVTRVSLLGPVVNIGVQVGTEEISIIAPRAQTPPREGQRVFVAWQPSACLLFADPDATSG
jgi:putative spermidine/putrescine transport system ATP-binding protein